MLLEGSAVRSHSDVSRLLRHLGLSGFQYKVNVRASKTKAQIKAILQGVAKISKITIDTSRPRTGISDDLSIPYSQIPLRLFINIPQKSVSYELRLETRA